jgi:hypothetical protein
MNISMLLFASATICALGGCAAVPEPPRHDGILVQDIVDRVQCELADVYTEPNRYGYYLENWLARVTLELKVTYDALAGAPTVTALPILSAGTLSVPVGPDLSDTSFRTANIVFDVHMRDLKPLHKNRVDTLMPNCSKPSGLPQAEASLGLADWAKTIALAAGRDDHASLYEAAYDLEFTIVRGVHGGIVFKATTVNIDAGSGLARKTSDNHLNVVFKNDPPASKSKGTGKTKASPSISQQLDLQRQRFLPQQLIIQNQRGLTIQ